MLYNTLHSRWLRLVHSSTISRTLERARQRLRRCLRYTL